MRFVASRLGLGFGRLGWYDNITKYVTCWIPAGNIEDLAAEGNEVDEFEFDSKR